MVILFLNLKNDILIGLHLMTYESSIVNIIELVGQDRELITM